MDIKNASNGHRMSSVEPVKVFARKVNCFRESDEEDDPRPDPAVHQNQKLSFDPLKFLKMTVWSLKFQNFQFSPLFVQFFSKDPLLKFWTN